MTTVQPGGNQPIQQHSEVPKSKENLDPESLPGRIEGMEPAGNLRQDVETREEHEYTKETRESTNTKIFRGSIPGQEHFVETDLGERKSTFESWREGLDDHGQFETKVSKELIKKEGSQLLSQLQDISIEKGSGLNELHQNLTSLLKTYDRSFNENDLHASFEVFLLLSPERDVVLEMLKNEPVSEGDTLGYMAKAAENLSDKKIPSFAGGISATETQKEASALRDSFSVRHEERDSHVNKGMDDVYDLDFQMNQWSARIAEFEGMYFLYPSESKERDVLQKATQLGAMVKSLINGSLKEGFQEHINDPDAPIKAEITPITDALGTLSSVAARKDQEHYELPSFAKNILPDLERKIDEDLSRLDEL